MRSPLYLREVISIGSVVDPKEIQKSAERRGMNCNALGVYLPHLDSKAPQGTTKGLLDYFSDINSTFKRIQHENFLRDELPLNRTICIEKLDVSGNNFFVSRAEKIKMAADGEKAALEDWKKVTEWECLPKRIPRMSTEARKDGKNV